MPAAGPIELDEQPGAAAGGPGPVDPSSTLALAARAAITTARTDGVRLFTRSPPAHSVILGRARLACEGSVRSVRAVALPAGTPHTLLSLADAHASVAYLDARYYRFEDAAYLAQRWRGFVPGRDDVRELLGDALLRPQRRVDRRLLRALSALEAGELDVPSAARQVDLSDSRLTHLMTETLGAPPRTWRAWFKLRHAIAETVLHGATLTQAAHRAGFVDSAHLTRTCKQLMGVAPARVLPRTIHVCDDAQAAAPGQRIAGNLRSTPAER
ncbi:MAG TPA: helix-turn-helix domain-containing protein [Polyangiales bacterium]